MLVLLCRHRVTKLEVAGWQYLSIALIPQYYFFFCTDFLAVLRVRFSFFGYVVHVKRVALISRITGLSSTSAHRSTA